MQSTSQITPVILVVIFISLTCIGCLPWFRSDNSEEQQEVRINHLGVIMDGNRRWARKRGLPPWEGHRQGARALEKTIEYCLKREIPHLTVYAFSIENFKRSQEELDFLFNTLAHELSDKNLEKLKQQQVHISVIGDHSLFPPSLVELINSAEHETAHNAKLHFNILFCYGGKQELVEGCKTIAHKIETGELTTKDIDEQTVAHTLWSAKLPELDLVIRTGGDKRLSNFLLFLLSYTELFFVDYYWPEMTEKKLDQIFAEFNKRKRNFGA